MELTPSSVRCAPASGCGSCPAMELTIVAIALVHDTLRLSATL